MKLISDNIEIIINNLFKEYIKLREDYDNHNFLSIWRCKHGFGGCNPEELLCKLKKIKNKNKIGEIYYDIKKR